MTTSILIRGAGIILSAGLCLAAAQSADTPPAAAAFDLVTESEANTWNTAEPTESDDFKTRDLGEYNASPTFRSTANNDADNPKIRIVAPTIEKPLIAPFDIELQFTQAGSSRIRPETFRICYLGLVTMDITTRVTVRAGVSEQGLHISGDQLPHG